MSHKHKKHDQEDEKSQKELMKSLETPEEKRLRRLAKKERKQRRIKEEMGWDDEHMGYTNTDNPFGDTNLLNTFVWKKKLEKEGLHKLSKEDIEFRSKQKIEENKLELAKVKVRRLQREKEREDRESEMTRVQREKEAASFKEWERQEDSFHLKQARLRSKIRIEDGRAKPIDLLARYISSEEEDFTVEMHEPYVYLNGLSCSDLEDLQVDIKVYMELENGKNLDYWKDLQVIVDDEIHKLRDKSSDHRESINTAVSSEIVSIFKNKTPSQLQAMHRQIKKKTDGGEGVDITYWETLLSRLNAYMARARLRERHQENLRHKLYKLKEEQGVQAQPLFPCVRQTDEPPSSTTTSTDEAPPAPEPSTSTQEEEESIVAKRDPKPPPVKQESYDSGRYSPVLIRLSKVEPGVLLVNPDEDTARIEFMQRRLLSGNKPDTSLDPVSAEEKAFEKIARKGMDSEEAIFSVEHFIDKSYVWADKYRPRKPRYFNRVHTGFEWNKYNQTHYDIENPPPKLVQGYKFNIFYPDLIDKTQTPEYSIHPCDDNKDFAVLKFKAGPPYETIAFKIVNREWEYSYKRGFRCQFHNNIFQLWFHFKRYRYRR